MIPIRFLHDRVQEAAYSLIPEDQRAAAHLRIGTPAREHTPPDKREEGIFEIVNQLNRGSHLITSLRSTSELQNSILSQVGEQKYPLLMTRHSSTSRLVEIY